MLKMTQPFLGKKKTQQSDQYVYPNEWVKKKQPTIFYCAVNPLNTKDQHQSLQ